MFARSFMLEAYFKRINRENFFQEKIKPAKSVIEIATAETPGAYSCRACLQYSF